MKLRTSDSTTETSSSTTKRDKIVCKESSVIPSNYHLEEKQYAALVSLDGKSTYSAWFNTKEEAEKVRPLLEEALDYRSYPTMAEESEGPEGVRAMNERVRIMDERYKKSGRDNPEHPMHSVYTGLAAEYGEVPNNNPE
tara:strand:- start:646 stop:1062 length:417 start_codon:yes stop_codon:yes gene_type:complete